MLGMERHQPEGILDGTGGTMDHMQSAVLMLVITSGIAIREGIIMQKVMIADGDNRDYILVLCHVTNGMSMPHIQLSNTRTCVFVLSMSIRNLIVRVYVGIG